MMLFHQAPQFTLRTHSEEEIHSSRLAGKYLVLYFYPKASTPGCTREAQDFTALLPQFSKLDARIVGVSPDKPETQAKFVAARSLKVTMLSDSDKTLAREFAALKEGGGILRSTFLIDRAGTVRAQWKKVKVAGHAEEVLETLQALYESDRRTNPVIAARRARRALSEELVSREEIDTLIEAAHLAPSCFNNQPWRFVAIDDPETLTAVKAEMPKGNYWTRPAPAIIALASKCDLDCKLSDNRDYFLFGCGMAASNMMVQATQMGLVAHPIAGFDPIKTKEILGIPEDYTLITLVVIGRQGDADVLSEKHREAELGARERRPLTDVLFWNQFNQ
ncbi:MAG: redoxin domain-containing protein [Candidatus Bipolaricaulota bacterium]|nr:redoxin domain-containing protein [Candidatus Bipolaricaulota bacterium]